jgi:hypothetical protein
MGLLQKRELKEGLSGVRPVGVGWVCGCRPVDAARGLEDRLRIDNDKYYDRIKMGINGLLEEVLEN